MYLLFIGVLSMSTWPFREEQTCSVQYSLTDAVSGLRQAAVPNYPAASIGNGQLSAKSELLLEVVRKEEVFRTSKSVGEWHKWAKQMESRP